MSAVVFAVVAQKEIFRSSPFGRNPSEEEEQFIHLKPCKSTVMQKNAFSILMCNMTSKQMLPTPLAG